MIINKSGRLTRSFNHNILVFAFIDHTIASGVEGVLAVTNPRTRGSGNALVG